MNVKMAEVADSSSRHIKNPAPLLSKSGIKKKDIIIRKKNKDGASLTASLSKGGDDAMIKDNNNNIVQARKVKKDEDEKSDEDSSSDSDSDDDSNNDDDDGSSSSNSSDSDDDDDDDEDGALGTVARLRQSDDDDNDEQEEEDSSDSSDDDDDDDDMEDNSPSKLSVTRPAVAAASDMGADDDDDVNVDTLDDGDANDDDDGNDDKKKQRGRRPNAVVHQLRDKVIQITELPNGINEQTCLYCGKQRFSKQFQTTFWTLHIINQKKNEDCLGFSYECPKCPLATRRIIASMSKAPEAKDLVSSNSFFRSTSTRTGRPIKKRKFIDEYSDDDNMDNDEAKKKKLMKRPSGSGGGKVKPKNGAAAAIASGATLPILASMKRGADRNTPSPGNKRARFSTGILYDHVKIEKSEYSTQLTQYCNYCDQMKKYKQLQAEYWFKHFLNFPNKKGVGCPNCPATTRQEIYDAIKAKTCESKIVRDIVVQYENIYDNPDGLSASDAAAAAELSSNNNGNLLEAARDDYDEDDMNAAVGEISRPAAASKWSTTEDDGGGDEEDDETADKLDKEKRTVLWQQVSVTREGGVGTKYLGICKHCDLFKREAYHLQSTQFALHYVDLTNYHEKKSQGKELKRKPGRQSSSCPNCPIKARKLIAKESKSSAVIAKARACKLFDAPSDDDDDDDLEEQVVVVKKEEDTDTDDDIDGGGAGKKKAAVATAVDVPKNESAKATKEPPSIIPSQAGAAAAAATAASHAIAETTISGNNRSNLDNDVRTTLKAIQTQMQELLTNQATMMSAIRQIQNHLGLNDNGADKSGGGGNDGDDDQKKKNDTSVQVDQNQVEVRKESKEERINSSNSGGSGRT